MLLGITGTNGAGKGTVVDYLVTEKGFTHYSVREEIVREIEARGLPVNRPNMNEVGTELRQMHGPDYFTDLFVARAKAAGHEHVVIESIRNPFEAKRLHELGGHVVTIDAEKQVRYDRITGRASATDAVSFEDFCAQEDREMSSEDPSNPAKMNIRGIFEAADYHLTNNGTLSELHTQIEEMLKQFT